MALDNCPVCKGTLQVLPETDTGDSIDQQCLGCGRTWREDEEGYYSLPMKVTITKIPEVGDKYTDLIKPINKVDSDGE